MPNVIRCAAVIVMMVLAVPLAAQEPGPEIERSLQPLKDQIAAFRQQVEQHRLDIERKTEVLETLLEAAGEVAAFGPSLSLSRAQRKLEEARAAAEKDTPLSEPVPLTLQRLQDVLTGRRAALDPARTRAEAFVALNPLEQHLAQLAESALEEAKAVERAASSVQILGLTLRSASTRAAQVLVRVRKDALE